MKREDIPQGTIAEFRDGVLGILVNETFITYSKGGRSLGSYYDNLERINPYTHEYDISHEDIIKLYRVDTKNLNASMQYWLADRSIINKEHATCIWDRDEKKITISKKELKEIVEEVVSKASNVEVALDKHFT